MKLLEGGSRKKRHVHRPRPRVSQATRSRLGKALKGIEGELFRTMPLRSLGLRAGGRSCGHGGKSRKHKSRKHKRRSRKHKRRCH